MSINAPWDDFLAYKDNFIGGDLISEEDGEVFRGPVSSIEVKAGIVSFNRTWCAHNTPDSWKNWPDTGSAVNMEYSTPMKIGEGRIRMSVPFLGSFTFLPKDGDHLDPSEVEGLMVEN